MEIDYHERHTHMNPQSVLWSYTYFKHSNQAPTLSCCQVLVKSELMILLVKLPEKETFKDQVIVLCDVSGEVVVQKFSRQHPFSSFTSYLSLTGK